MLSAVDERRWLLPSPLGGDGPASAAGAADVDLPAELLALLRRRGLVTAEAVRRLLDPEAAPDPETHFPGLSLAVERLVRCCRGAEVVAICGDYDADGMTSTALLVGVLQRLGARPRAAIPSRMEDGYGLNAAMVERLAAEGVRLLITVDNGVAASEALERAAALQVEVILTDHHTLPPQLPPHLALLHPAVTPEDSPYRGLAGVGLAHVLATALCRRLRHRHGLEIALNLFCIGTIADMAPLEGVNRRWLLDGLPLLGRSPLPGLQALQQLAGLEKHRVDAEAVGFQLAPRINAVGRLGDPQLVVDLLTTEDPERALELARSCDALNRQRRELCSAIEAEALALLEADGPHRPAFLLLAQGHWHHGVIGIVASRLVERFGRPVALLAGEGGGRLRASVRAPKGFAVDAALTACADLLERHGGHPAAGGFTVRAENVAALQERLDALASRWLEAVGEGRSVEPEALLRLERIDREFWRQLQRLAPFGIGHPTPLFWSSRCQVVDRKLLRGGHLQLQLAQGEARLRAIAWRWQGPDQWTGPVDVAYRLRRDDWQGVERFQLELEAIRCSGGDTVVLQRHNRTYWCRRQGDSLVIRNAAGDERRAAIPPGLTDPADSGGHPHPYVQGLLREAAMALGMVEG
ncbi:single-stranded-DNA-specific exonuclease RecJ [Microcystis elabens FACHB-917]|nr:single-stranded-DNA-specific exonuclease RecJ [Microcystis elabens FACHB-917]